MDEKIKVCKNCNAENDSDALFCCQCGQKLDEINQSNENTSENVALENQINNDFRTDVISEQEFYAYIGKNQNRFMPSFRKFFTGKKASFSPLVFLLTWLISPIASSFWFFHRKINKLGTLLLSIGIVFTIITSALTVSFVNDVINLTTDYIDNYGIPSYSSNSNAKLNPTTNYDDDFFREFFDEEANDYYDYDDKYDDDYDNNYDDDYYDYDDNYDDDNNVLDDQFKSQLKSLIPTLFRYTSILSIISILQLVLAIVMGIFAKYWYFKDAAKKITEIKQQNPTPSSINQIAFAGGTNCLIWVIALIAVVICSVIFALAFTVNIVTEFLPYVQY